MAVRDTDSVSSAEWDADVVSVLPENYSGVIVADPPKAYVGRSSPDANETEEWAEDSW